MGIPAVFRFILHDGEIVKLVERDLEVACMKERMGEDLVENQVDIFVDNIMTTVNMKARLHTGNQLFELVYKWSLSSLCILLVIQ